MNIASIILLVLCVGFTSISSALDPNRWVTQYVHDFWDMDDGLPDVGIMNITQTRDGYLWLATTNGLARFDGSKFHVFDSTNTKEIGAADFYALRETADGTLWIGLYWGGLLSYKDGKFRKYGKEDGLTDLRILWIISDRKDNLWLGTPNGLFKMHDGKFTRFWKEEGLPGHGVWAILEDHEGTIWAGTIGGGLYYLKDGRFLKFTKMEQPDILSLLEDRQGNFWIGTDAGLYRIQNGNTKRYTSQTELKGDVIPALLQDRDGNVWIGTNAGLTRFYKETFQTFTSEHGLPAGEVSALHEDREGNLWVSSTGLSRLHNGKFLTFSKSEGLADDQVKSIHGNDDGDVWIGHSVGISRLRQGKVENFSLDEQTKQWTVYTVFEDSRGTVWVGTGGAGLYVLNEGKIIPFSKTDQLLATTVWGLYEDNAGSIWAANFGRGINQLVNGKIKAKFTEKEGLSSFLAQAFHQDQDGSLLILTEDGGVNRYKDGKFSVYISQDELQHQVWTIYRDADNVLWMGSCGGGIKRYQNGKVVTIRRIHGLYEDMIGNILEDSNGDFWISSGKGIFRVSKKELNDFAAGKVKTVHSFPYGKSDGLKSTRCAYGFQPAAWKSPDGKLWFPILGGAVMIDPSNIKKNQMQPPVLVEDVFVDGQKLESTADGKWTLAPGKEKFEFRYTALSLVDDTRVHFKYKLDGYDQHWTDAGARRIAYYTSIPPGSYTFRVMASNNDGIWNETGAAASFYLRPYFYQTAWFYLVCTIFVIVAALGLHRLRIRRLRTEFQAVLSERARIAREIHDGLAQALAAVVMQLETAQLVRIPERSQEFLDRALVLARQSVQDARRAIGDLRIKAVAAADFPETLRSKVQQQLDGTVFKLDFQVEGSPVSLSDSAQAELLHICREAVQNAIKHSQTQEVTVKLQYQSDATLLVIQDSGRGFDPAAKPDGHFGLIGMRERASQLGATFDVQSSPGNGTRIQITIPTNGTTSVE